MPPENGRILARAIPHAALVMLPRASHIFMTDQFDPASRAMLAFLDQASAETTAIKASMWNSNEASPQTAE